jgi:nitric oxide reductase NorD protein
VNDTAHSETLSRLGMLASALSGRDLRTDDAGPGKLAWTDGNVVYVDSSSTAQVQLMQLCVQSALLAAGSLDTQIVRQLARRPKLAKRYLAVEAPRALAMLRDVLPPVMRPLLDNMTVSAANSALASLQIALGRELIESPPQVFGEIHARKLLAAQRGATGGAAEKQHIPRKQQQRELAELDAEAIADDGNSEDFASSSVGGGGSLGKWLQKMYQMVRQLQGGGTPGADAPTHWSRSGPRAVTRSLSSASTVETVDQAFGKGAGILYPEWNVHRGCYQLDWCTIQEIDPPARPDKTVPRLDDYALRKPLLQLGMGLDHFHRQAQGDDIDIDAAIELQLELLAGSVPHEAIYIESQRHRRDLSVMVLLDISGSVAQAGAGDTSVDQQQRRVAAALTTALYDIGDRVALYAFHSQGRSAVHLVPLKRFEEHLHSAIMQRMFSLVPGAYSRLGAAIRHAATLLIERGGTSRRLLVVLSDGLAYDHGYEPAYGAADARQALGEARRDGVACVCLNVGGDTGSDALRRVFGSAAFASVPNPGQLVKIIGPLFRGALHAAQVQRRVA